MYLSFQLFEKRPLDYKPKCLKSFLSLRNLRNLRIIDLSPDQVRQPSQGDGLPGTDGNADIAIPAVIAVAHEGDLPLSHSKHIHGAHLHAEPALIAFLPVHFQP
jgi:hypothetical protein